MKETLPDTIRTVVDDVCREAGVVCISADLRGQAKQLILDIVIDTIDGIRHEHCTAVSRGIDARLENDPFAGRLRAVDVSSPGADTPVKHLWQLQRSEGRMVHVVCTNGQVEEGTLLRVLENALEVQPSRKKNETKPPITISESEIAEARVVIQF